MTGIDTNVFTLWLFVATLIIMLTLPRSIRVVTKFIAWKLAGRVKPLPDNYRGVWRCADCPRWSWPRCSCSH